MKEPPDLVLSGVNRGRNCAEDVTYSGTVAGAMEGTVLGIPSFALSQAYALHHQAQSALGDGDQASRPTSSAACSRPACRATCWSTSIFPIARPARSPASPSRRKASATRNCCASTRATTGAAIPITGSPSRRGGIAGAAHGSDLAALNDKRIAVTPLRLDLTDEPFMTKLAEVFELAQCSYRNSAESVIGRMHAQNHLGYASRSRRARS